MARRTPSSKITQVAIGAILVFGMLLFLFTGLDPLGIFGNPGNPPGGVVTRGSSDGTSDWWEVYFTDPATVNSLEQLNASIAGALIEDINQARQTIHIAAFEFNLTPLATALIEAHRRGVQVRWVTDDEHGLEADIEDGHGQFALMQAAGVQMKDDQRSALMHNKFIIIDGQTVWTGSTNLTHNGMFRNNNNSIVIHSPEIAAIFEAEFAEMWAGSFGPRSPSTVDEQRVNIAGSAIQVLFAAEDEVVNWLLPLIEGAQRNIRFMAFSFTQDDLGMAMRARAQSGVNVRGIFEKRGSETEISELTAFYCAGIPVRQDGNPGILHHKVIVVDAEIVITGSYNFSESANENNDENVLLIANPEIAAKYLQEFNKRWAEATDPDPTDISCR